MRHEIWSRWEGKKPIANREEYSNYLVHVKFNDECCYKLPGDLSIFLMRNTDNSYIIDVGVRSKKILKLSGWNLEQQTHILHN